MSLFSPRLLALGSGALLTLSFAPFALWLASFASLSCLAYLLSQHRHRAIAISYWYGLGLFATGSSWVYVSIHDYGNTHPLLALILVGVFVLGLSLFFALFGLSYKWLYRPRWGPITFASLWVLCEWLRSVILTGFPWLYVGYGHIDTWLAGYIPVFGVYGASFVAALVSAYAAAAWGRRQIDQHLLVPAGLLVLCWPLHHIHWTTATGPELRIAAVQPNLSLHEKWDRNNLGKILYQLQQQTLAVEDSDIIVWPEASIPANYPALSNFVDQLVARANAQGYTLIAGMPYKAETNAGKRYYNSQWVSAQGEAKPAFYFKQHLVPFGEYVPFEQWLRGLIAFFDLPSSHFSAGSSNQPQLFANATPIAIYICYEVAYPDLVARSATTATLLFTTSNDAWFGNSVGPKQHYQIAATRALENGKPMVRVTNNGITGYIDHRGHTTAAIPAFEQTQLQAKVQPMLGSTPFSRFGSSLIVGICLALIGTSAVARGRRNP